jgi:benzoyl-CoA reductase/2-hydroxyglutaryl-CoA dehydratase subunit BcrC/BadD/HgdB
MTERKKRRKKNPTVFNTLDQAVELLNKIKDRKLTDQEVNDTIEAAKRRIAKVGQLMGRPTQAFRKRLAA